MGRMPMSISLVLATALSGPSAGCQSRSSDATPLPLARTEPEKKILSLLDEMRQSGRIYLSVPVSDGRVLRLLTEAVGAKTVVEIGTSTGYSGLWFCLVAEDRRQANHVEIDSGRAATARKHFEQAGVAEMVNVIEGDAHEKLSGLKGPIDVAFIDADKEGYVDYLNKLLPLVRPGGLILAHSNDHGRRKGRIRQAGPRQPRPETIFYNDGVRLGVTLKKR